MASHEHICYHFIRSEQTVSRLQWTRGFFANYLFAVKAHPRWTPGIIRNLEVQLGIVGQNDWPAQQLSVIANYLCLFNRMTPGGFEKEYNSHLLEQDDNRLHINISICQ